MKKYRKLTAIIFMLLLLLTGCGTESEEMENGEAERQDTEEEILVASFENISTGIADNDDCQLINETLYYSQSIWNEDTSALDKEIYRWSVPFSENNRVLIYESAKEGEELTAFFADLQNNLYCWGYSLAASSETGEQDVFIEKRDQDNKLVFRIEIPFEISQEMERNNIREFVVDEGGKMYFYSAAGDILVLDEKGKVIGQADVKMKKNGSVVIGSDQQVWFYGVEEDGISFYRLDLLEGNLGMGLERQKLLFDEKGKNAAVFCGYDKGIYIVMDNKLYCYFPESNELNEVADLDSAYVNIAENEICLAAPFREETAVILGDRLGNFTDLAILEKKMVFELPKRQEIVLGVMGELVKENLAMNRVVRNFNRDSLEWQVVVKDYSGGAAAAGFEDMQNLYLKLLEGSGPDMLLLDSTWNDIWAKNGLLEDLEPYFDKSKTIGCEDILESIWESCFIDRSMIGIPLYFRLSGFSVKKESVPDKTVWDYNTLLYVAENHPDQYLLAYMNPVWMMSTMMKMNVSDFVDYQNFTCNFDQHKFQNLLRRISNLTYPPDSEDFKQFAREFIESPYLMKQEYFLSMQDYLAWKENYNGRVVFQGYPFAGEKGKYVMTADMIGMSSASDQKDGVWNFLEYALAKPAQTWDYQTQLRSFPIRKDCFEEYLRNSYPNDPQTSLVVYQPCEEDFEEVRAMVENAQVVPNNVSDPIMFIVTEEIQAYFAGDKTLEDVTGIIQNRCQLYLSELKG